MHRASLLYTLYKEQLLHVSSDSDATFRQASHSADSASSIPQAYPNHTLRAYDIPVLSLRTTQYNQRYGRLYRNVLVLCRKGKRRNF